MDYSSNQGKDAKISTPKAADPTSLYLKQVGMIKLLNREEEYALLSQAQSGDKDAFNQLVESNLRIVVKIAMQYKNRGVALLDIIEEGNMGLMHAVEKFDLETGFRFSTYAVWWVRQSIERAIMQQSRTVRLPVHVIKKLSICYRTGQAVAKKIGYEPGVEELAKELNQSVKQVSQLLEHGGHMDSLDRELHEDGSSDLHEVIGDDEEMEPSRVTAMLAINQQLNEALDHLEPELKDVVIYRYGLRGEDPHTLDQVAEHTGLHREKVRVVCRKALTTMKRYLKRSGADFNDLHFEDF